MATKATDDDDDDDVDVDVDDVDRCGCGCGSLGGKFLQRESVGAGEKSAATLNSASSDDFAPPEEESLAYRKSGDSLPRVRRAGADCSKELKCRPRLSMVSGKRPSTSKNGEGETRGRIEERARRLLFPCLQATTSQLIVA